MRVIRSPDPINLLINLSTMMETMLTSSGHSETNSGRMPRPDTGYFPVATMCLPWKFLCPPAMSHAFEAMTFRNRNYIDHFIWLEDISDRNSLLELGD